jgi:tetratricopeptide (TPR) repeat protein
MINLDLSLMDVDGIRLKRRKKLLLLSAGPLIAILLISLKLLSPTISNSQLKSSYNSGNYDTALFWSNTLKFINILEPYIAPFNQGNILFKQQQYPSAEIEYILSLSLHPPRSKICLIRVNLSLSIEAQADILLKDKEYDQAILAYDRAKMAIYQDNCANTLGTGESEAAERSKERIIAKQEEAMRLRNDDPENENDPDSSTRPETPRSPNTDQQKELEERQREFQTERQRRGRNDANRNDDWSNRPDQHQPW